VHWTAILFELMVLLLVAQLVIHLPERQSLSV